MRLIKMVKNGNCHRNGIYALSKIPPVGTKGTCAACDAEFEIEGIPGEGSSSKKSIFQRKVISRGKRGKDFGWKMKGACPYCDEADTIFFKHEGTSFSASDIKLEQLNLENPHLKNVQIKDLK